MSELWAKRDPTIENEYYIVGERGSQKWWTASLQDCGWYIMTGNQMRIVQEDGRLGRKIIKAIEDEKALREMLNGNSAHE